MGIGGVESGIRDIANYLTKKNIQNYILCENKIESVFNNDLNIITLDGLKFKHVLHQRKIKKILISLIKKYMINLVHISSRAPAFYLLNFLKSKGIKVVTSVHAVYSSNNFLKSWYNSFLEKGDSVIYNSFFIKSVSKYHPKAVKNQFVVPRGINLNYFKESNIKKLNNNKKLKLIFLPSRVSNQKGHEILIQYFSKLPTILKKEFKIHFISSYKSNTEINLINLIKKFKLTGSVIISEPTLDIRQYYRDCYLVVSFSKRPEGFGRTISEALAMAKPVLASNIGGAKEQLEKFDKNLLFDLNSFDAFYHSFKYIIKNYNKIIFKGPDFIKSHYSSDEMCKKTLKIYLKTLL